eukprot:SAG31_NODE_42153_length_273_cov_0.270115_1_plen_73_part_01
MSGAGGSRSLQLALKLWQRDNMLSVVTDSQLDAGHPRDLLMKQMIIDGHNVQNSSLAGHIEAIRDDSERYIFS